MNTILTTHGPIDMASIDGSVLAHEHLIVDLHRTDDQNAVLQVGDPVAQELADCREHHGLGLVIEMTCRGMGRDVVGVDVISQTSGVPVVVGSGYYYEEFHDRDLSRLNPYDLAEEFITEITSGVDDTGIRVGVLGEIGTHGPTPSPAELVCLTAVALAAQETGVAVATHAHLGVGGRGQLDVLTKAGLTPDRISIGHQDLLEDPPELLNLARDGVYLAFDTIGKAAYRADSARASALVALIDAGFGSQLLVSNDISRRAYLKANGGQGYAHTLKFADTFRKLGVDEGQLRAIYHDNPLRLYRIRSS